MAMNGDTLAGEIKTAIDAILPTGSNPADLNYLKALANAIVTHIKTNAEISGTTTGVTTGMGTAPTTGTIS